MHIKRWAAEEMGMRSIAVLNPKGGSGKSTLATVLARGLEDAGHSVLLVDADPQGTIRDWQAVDDENPTPVVAMDRAENLKSLPTMPGYDFAIIDGAGRVEKITQQAIRLADLALIPTQPSPYDIWAIADLVELIQGEQMRRGLPVMGAVISRAIQGTVLDREVTDALEGMALEYLDARTHQRQVYPRSANEGRTPLEVEPNGKAAQEIRDITAEVLALFE